MTAPEKPAREREELLGRLRDFTDIGTFRLNADKALALLAAHDARTEERVREEDAAECERLALTTTAGPRFVLQQTARKIRSLRSPSPAPAPVTPMPDRVVFEGRDVPVAEIDDPPDECHHDGIELPEERDESGRRLRFPVRVRCPECGADVEVR